MSERKQGNGTLKIVGLIVAAGVIAFSAWNFTPINPMVDAQNAIKAELSDPSSATFREMRFSTTSAATVVCGEVNSRNRFGGMVGYERFYAMELPTMWLVTYASENGDDYRRFCNS